MRLRSNIRKTVAVRTKHPRVGLLPLSNLDSRTAVFSFSCSRCGYQTKREWWMTDGFCESGTPSGVDMYAFVSNTDDDVDPTDDAVSLDNHYYFHVLAERGRRMARWPYVPYEPNGQQIGQFMFGTWLSWQHCRKCDARNTGKRTCNMDSYAAVRSAWVASAYRNWGVRCKCAYRTRYRRPTKYVNAWCKKCWQDFEVFRIDAQYHKDLLINELDKRGSPEDPLYHPTYKLFDRNVCGIISVFLHGYDPSPPQFSSSSSSSSSSA